MIRKLILLHVFLIMLFIFSFGQEDSAEKTWIIDLDEVIKDEETGDINLGWKVYREGEPQQLDTEQLKSYSFNVNIYKDSTFQTVAETHSVSGLNRIILGSYPSGPFFIKIVSPKLNIIKANEKFAEAKVSFTSISYFADSSFMQLFNDFYLAGDIFGRVIIIILSLLGLHSIFLFIHYLLKWNTGDVLPFPEDSSYIKNLFLFFKYSIKKHDNQRLLKIRNLWIDFIYKFGDEEKIIEEAGEDSAKVLKFREEKKAEIEKFKQELSVIFQGNQTAVKSIYDLFYEKYLLTHNHWSSSSRIDNCLQNKIEIELDKINGIVHPKKSISNIIKAPMSWFWTLSGLAPMLGLLGTVIGISDSFNMLVAGGGDMGGSVLARLADGVHTALNTTIFGLVVGIPVLLFYYYLNEQQNYFKSVIWAEIDEITKHI